MQAVSPRSRKQAVPGLHPSSLHSRANSGNLQPRPGTQPSAAQRAQAPPPAPRRVSHVEHHGARLSLRAANTYQALSDVLDPMLSALQTLCHSTLASACNPEPSIKPMLSLLPARSPKLTSAKPTQGHFWATITSFLRHVN